MKIPEIQNFAAVANEIKSSSKKEKVEKNQLAAQDKIEISTPSAAWQKDILMKGIEKLENSKQLDNKHPLDRIENAPIESFEEALIELQFLKSSVFAEQLSNAQANLVNQDVLQLFVGD